MPIAPSTVRFGLFEVDLQSGELFKAGIKVRLGDQPFKILAMLLEHPERVVTREELRQRLWSSDTFVDFEQGLNAAVKRLREALCDSAEHPRYIETIPRHGYRLTAAIVIVDPGTHNVAAAQTPEPPPASRRVLWILAVLFIAAALLVIRFWPWKQKADVRDHGISVPIHSIAVLPLENLSNDPGQEYFSDGMTELLITELAKARSLHVISRRSVMRFKGTTKTIGEIGKELKVEALVEGAVLKEGNTVRVSAQLLRVDPEEHLWAQDYERDLTKVLAPQRELALAVVTELRIQLAPREQTHIVSAYTANYPAMDAYFRGLNEQHKFTPAAGQNALAAFQRSISLDPAYALPHYGLADVYKDLIYAAPIAPGEVFLKAEAEARKAIQLDPNLADAHTVLGWAKAEYYYDWAAAQSEFKRAIEINPNSVDAHRRYAWFLAWIKRWNEADEQLRIARELEPCDLWCYRVSGIVLFSQRQYDAAAEEWKKALKSDPNIPILNSDLGRVYAHMGRYDQAIPQLERARDLLGGETGATATGGGFLGYAYARAGRRPEALNVLQEMLARSRRGYVSPLHIATIYIGLGDKQRALQWIEKAYTDRDADMVALQTVPEWDSLRSDPRFQGVLRRMNFPPS